MPARISVDDQNSLKKEVTVNPTPATILDDQEKTIPTSTKVDHQSAVDRELDEKAGNMSLSAFVVHPPGIFFSGKEPSEEIILLLRAHVITNVPWIIAVIILALLPVFVFPLLISFNILPVISPGLGIVLSLFWYMAVFTYAFIKFLYWYFNVYIVTNERVIDVDWYSIIYRMVSSTPIAKIQDVSASQGGVIASIFDFGDVQVQTAGEERNFEFDSVPHPQLVAKKIEELMHQEEEEGEKDDI